MNEITFQRKVKKRIEFEFPGCIVLRNDPQQIQGIPDLIVLFGPQWAALEVKDSINAPRQPNQDYYIDVMNNMSFASFVYPDNLEEVVYGLQDAFSYIRTPRVS